MHWHSFSVTGEGKTFKENCINWLFSMMSFSNIRKKLKNIQISMNPPQFFKQINVGNGHAFSLG